MPTLRMAAIPPPSDWREFEKMTRDAFSVKWSSPNLQLIGRPGQAQNGVDVHGADYLGRMVGMQCKRLDTPLSIGTVRSEAIKAEKFKPSIAAYYMVTTTPTDAKLQSDVRTLSEERLQDKKFPVGIFFWEDVLRELAATPSLFQQYYPDFANPSDIVVTEGLSSLAVLDIAFHGTRLKHYLDLLFGQFSSMEDPHAIVTLTRILEHCVLRIFSGEIRIQLLRDIRLTSELSLRARGGESDLWDSVQLHATSAESTITGLEYHLKGHDLLCFKFGRYMAYWDHHLLGDKLNAVDIRTLEDLISNLLDAEDAKQAIGMVEAYQVDAKFIPSVGPHQIFSFVRDRTGTQDA